MGILVPRQGIELWPPAVEAWGPNHWTTRKVSNCYYFLLRQRQQSYMLAGIGVPKVSRVMIKDNVKMLVAQSSTILCNSKDCSPLGSSIHGILHARILEWIAIPFSQPKDQTLVSLQADSWLSEPPSIIWSKTTPLSQVFSIRLCYPQFIEKETEA